jgi:hypothetical protein
MTEIRMPSNLAFRGRENQRSKKRRRLASRQLKDSSLR